MLKEAGASKAAKLLMTCVCPVAGTTALSLGVPQVRDAVHKATQPRQYAKPKTRTRAVTPAASEGVQVAQADSPCPSVTPFALNNLPVTSSPPTVLAVSTPPGDPLPPPIPGPPLAPPTPGGNPFVTNAAVPEPQTWVQLVLGFGVIGGVARVTYRRNGTDPKSGPAAS